MRLNQCVHSRRHHRAFTHQFHAILGDYLDLALLAKKWLAALQRPKLPLPEHLPAAAVVFTDFASAGGKDSGLHRLKVRLRHIETELVHHTPLACCS